MKRSILLALSLLVRFSCFAVSDLSDSTVRQKLYHVNKPVVATITGVGLFSDYFAISRIKNKQDISTEELATLNRHILTPFDRWALYQSTTDQSAYRSLGDYGQVPLILL